MNDLLLWEIMQKDEVAPINDRKLMNVDEIGGLQGEALKGGAAIGK